MIGSSSVKADAAFMNVEACGLPKDRGSGDRPKLRNVRQRLENMLANTWPGSQYAKLRKPLAVEVEGSLCYDIDHQPGVVGPLGMRPTTVWGIHPIANLQRGQD